MARTQPTWTEVACTSSSSADGPSPADLQRLRAENEQHFQRLVDIYPLLPDLRPMTEFTCHSPELEFYNLVHKPPFFTDFGGRLEVRRKVGGGGQAEIYKALLDGEVDKLFVLKVIRSDSALADLQRTWATEIGSSFVKWKGGAGAFLGSCCFVQSVTLLKDGRFAFVMDRYWGDLRKALTSRSSRTQPTSVLHSHLTCRYG